MPPLPPHATERVDETPDDQFYAFPRMVVHIDDATIAALTEYYAEVLTPDADVLDLMSSWVSHLPENPKLGRVTGLGMNAEELAANPRLSERLVHDLNQTPVLPFDDASFDFVVNAVSVQYLARPHEVFAEIGRVLRPGGRSVVAMSHRCFPTKAIRAFHVAGSETRFRLVEAYHAETRCFDSIERADRSPDEADPLWIVTATRSA
ncbi:MAG: class I SAM-dependent methyltransferase [Myxococcota bacterium]